MHPNPIYRKAPRAQNIAFARAEAFGVLAVAAADGAPLVSHVPFLLSEDGARAEMHLVRSNPIARALAAGARPARLAVQGPHGYISPDWYGLPDQVPTWNYVAVHLTGALRLLPDADLPGVLERLSAAMEARLAPKPAWTLEKMSGEAAARMMRQIVPVVLEVAEIEGTWKLAQNKPEPARLGAAKGLEAAGSGAETAALAALMRRPPA